MKSLIVALFGACLAASPVARAQAQDGQIADHQRRVAQAKDAERVGAQMHAFDRAAWHATDRFLADAGGDPAALASRFEGISGYVVVPTETETQLETLFVARRGESLVAVSHYRVEGSGVLSGEIFAAGREPALSPLASRMFAAREAVLAEAAARNVQLCTASAPNTVVLPPNGDGTITAYLLTSSISTTSYPLGGHYRVRLAADGAVAEFRPFAETCVEAEWDPQDDELAMTSFVVTHLLDDHPTEIHAFVSAHLPYSLGVVTGDAIWPVIGGAVADPVPIDADSEEWSGEEA